MLPIPHRSSDIYSYGRYKGYIHHGLGTLAVILSLETSLTISGTHRCDIRDHACVYLRRLHHI